MEKNVYSQNGEDGVIQYLLNNIIDKNYWCCEFGAWDGKYLSNTFNLVENYNYNAIYIEGDKSKYEKLNNLSKQRTKIIPISAFIEIEGDRCLDNILKTTSIPIDFDILSIDVDGLDYLIWESFKNYEPKIVIIEINSSFSPEIQFFRENLEYSDFISRIGKANSGINFTTCYNLAKQKNYKLFKHTGNMIFVHNKYEQHIKNLANDDNYLMYFNDKWLRTEGIQKL